MLLFKIHQQFKDHFLNELRVSFKTILREGDFKRLKKMRFKLTKFFSCFPYVEFQTVPIYSNAADKDLRK